MTLLTPLALLAALLALPIVLLYMLRLRRREVVVSSHFLWQQVLQESEANTPWQRLRRNLLLLLQLMSLALLVLALVRPAQVIETISAGRTVLLLDASASMSATDADGQSRFEAAKARAREIIANLGPQDELMLIRVADVTAPVTPYTRDANQLRAALDAMQPGQGAGRLVNGTHVGDGRRGGRRAVQYPHFERSGNIPAVGQLARKCARAAVHPAWLAVATIGR
ncbi:MAG: VWA domain-containing protein [Nitrospiraceae bacterium]|nr:VWA domain-containing protein [Nitrospiraceae bacterium]